MRYLLCAAFLACHAPTFASHSAGEAKAIVQEVTRAQNNVALLFVVDANAPVARAQALATELALFAPGSAAYHVMITTTDASDCARGSANEGRCGLALASDGQSAILASEALGDGLQAAMSSRLAALPANPGVSRALSMPR